MQGDGQGHGRRDGQGQGPGRRRGGAGEGARPQLRRLTRRIRRRASRRPSRRPRIVTVVPLPPAVPPAAGSCRDHDARPSFVLHLLVRRPPPRTPPPRSPPARRPARHADRARAPRSWAALPLLTSIVTGGAEVDGGAAGRALGRPRCPWARPSRPRRPTRRSPLPAGARCASSRRQPDHVGHRRRGRRRRLAGSPAPACRPSPGACSRARSAPRPSRRTPTRCEYGLPLEPTHTAVATCRV